MRAALVQLGRAVWLVHLHLIRILSALLQHIHDIASLCEELQTVSYTPLTFHVDVPCL
jgi:hypothetical protein